METDALHSWLLAWALTSPRILMAFAVLPILTDPIVPRTLRNGIVMIMTLFILPLTHQQFLNIELNVMGMLGILIKEALLGLLLGYTLSVPFWAVKAAGFMIDMQRGVMSALTFSPITANMVSPLGGLFSLFLTTLLLVSGGFLILMQTLYVSYQTWPIDQFYPHMTLEVTTFFLHQLDLLLYTALLIAGPFIGVMFLIDFGLGMVGRFLPQLNVFLAAMPVKSGLVFFMLTLYVGFLADYLKAGFLKMGSNLTLLDALLR
jgi:type III secretion protein T